MLKNEMSKNPAAIALAALSTDSVMTELQECVEKGIPVIGFDSGVMSVFPLDTYVQTPACVMDLTEGDNAKGMQEPVLWPMYARCVGADLGEIERYEFYERTRRAFLVIQTGEKRQYGNLLLTKGVVL